jgi:YHS domain-containing protein
LQDRRAEEHGWVRDPVCGMRVDEWTAKFFSEYQSRRYAFCSKRCKERFDENPTDYINQ